ncbi:hypothetical protein clem_13320 [Legionella clemsonensis]|uniref:Uncharacterized protein n=2 Tax=Legionella clemsonensis TaxID=1867846 RepID=A0A222P5V9_9GAMM|nr:hypothetical protein clem_13320 [Legionella clemsonensis]
MKYSELINPEALIPLESNFNKKYILIRSFNGSSFIYFRPRNLLKTPLYRKVDTNWKARLSIHSDDLNKAWDIIFPILCQKNTLFKVTNYNAIEKFKNDRQRKLDELEREYKQLQHNFNSQDINFLSSKYYKLSQELKSYSYSQWRLIAAVQKYYNKLLHFFYLLNPNKEMLFTRIMHTYECLIERRKQKVENALRFFDGMQFTLYILPGQEKQCQDMLEEIEVHLVREKIKAGIVHSTDRKIGIYSSIRHPGKTCYHKATDPNLETYNPDNINDPFSFLTTLSPTEIMQDEEVKEILKQSTSAQGLVALLQTKKFVAPSIFKALAGQKENIVSYIKAAPLESQQKLIEECLNKSTNLGRLFRVQRGFFTPKLGSGTLKQIENIQLTIK